MIPIFVTDSLIETSQLIYSFVPNRLIVGEGVGGGQIANFGILFASPSSLPSIFHTISHERVIWINWVVSFTWEQQQRSFVMFFNSFRISVFSQI